MTSMHDLPGHPVVIDGFPAYAPDLARDAPGYDPQHYRNLAELEASNFWFRARNRVILRALARHFPAARDYLEIGCGTGYVLSAVAARFPRMATSGSEIFVEGLSVAAARAPTSRLFQMDARKVPFMADFDVIGAFDVLEHIEDDVGVLGQLRTALRSGGGLVVTVPQHPWLWSAQDDDAHHVRRYRVGELEDKLSHAGFEVRWSSSFVALLLPLLALSRLSRRADVPDRDPYAELKLPPVVNSGLSAVMQCEDWLMRAGARFPIGGSRIIVATRTDR